MSERVPVSSTGVTLRTFGKFLIVGGSCYLLNLALLWIAVEKVGIHYVPATLLSVAAVMVLGHFLNRRHTFRSRERYVPELLRFMLNRSLQAGVGLGGIVLLVELAGIPYLLANILVTVITTIASFIADRWLVFGQSGAQRSLH